MISKNIETVISQRNYFIAFLIACLLMFAGLYWLTVVNTAQHSLGIYVEMNGFWYTTLGLLATIVTSILFGLYVALFSYRFKMQRNENRSNAVGFFGFIAGLFGAGCPTCGSVMLGLFGAPFGLMLLPFKGLEIKLLSVVLLGISVFVVARDPKMCSLKR